MRCLHLIALAALGLLAGAVGPLSPAPAHAGPPAREWVEAVNQRDGTKHLISGWRDAAGRLVFDPREYPDFVPAAKADPEKLPFPAKGVVQEKIPRPVAGQAWYGGNAAKVVEGGPSSTKAPDVHLTVIGSEWDQSVCRTNLERDPKFKALAAELGDRLAVQFYPPTDPMVARVGLVDGGKPDVVVQDAKGKELRRWHADPGAAAIVAEVRKADPDYRPGRDGDQAFSIDVSALSNPACVMIGVVAGLAGLGLYHRNKATRP